MKLKPVLNVINVLRTALTHVVPKSVKRLTTSLSLLCFWAPFSVKAVRRTLMKFKPDEEHLCTELSYHICMDMIQEVSFARRANDLNHRLCSSILFRRNEIK
jgi:hypothetical protein